jgi:hypothetical protein
MQPVMFFRSNLDRKIKLFIAQNVCPLLDLYRYSCNVKASLVVQIILEQLWSVMV